MKKHINIITMYFVLQFKWKLNSQEMVLPISNTRKHPISIHIHRTDVKQKDSM